MNQIKFIEENYPLFKNGTSNREIRHNFFSKIETELQEISRNIYLIHI